MIEAKDITEVGKFLKTHALSGELNAVFDIDADIIDTDTPLICDIDGIYVPFYPETLRPKGHFSSLVKLQGIDNVDEAKPFVNKTIYMITDHIPDLQTDEEGMYADQLVGYRVLADDGTPIGTIEQLDTSTQNALFIVADSDGNTIYLPAADQMITALDPDQRTITMTLPDGLIDLNKKQ